MSGYAYAPPPPPPSGASQANYPPPQQHHQGRGGGFRGRGGNHHGGRGGYQAGPPATYPYAGPHGYPHHGSYAGGQPPTHNGYGGPPQGWGPDAARGPPAHAPTPIVSSNYHPNYAPQSYAPPQYPPQHGYGQPPPQYSQPYQGPPPPNSQWNGQPPYGDRSRGGSHVSGPPRYDREVPPPHGAYGVPYGNDPRAGPYPPQPYPYQNPPGPPQDSHYGQPRRGRGGNRGHDARGRGNHHMTGKDRFSKSNHQMEVPRPVKHELPTVAKKKKRKTNTLGLTPGMDSESEDDEEEEKVLSELIGADALNVTDIAVFLAERKKHYPTKARVAARKAEREARSQSQSSQKPAKSEDKASLLEKQADKLRRQLRKVESSIKRKREQGDEGDEMRTTSSEESSDEEEQPEEVSSRTEAVSSLPPPAKRADVSKHCKYYATGGMCGKKGKCRFVHDPEVRQAAMKERDANNGRMTIQQRLILNDKDQEDLTILQSIQYLREKGVIDAAALKAQEAEKTAKKNKKHAAHTSTSHSSLLPAAPASLPAPPPKRNFETKPKPPSGTVAADHATNVAVDAVPAAAAPGPSVESSDARGTKPYQGWLLRPYGSTNGSSSQVDNLP